MRVSKQCVDCGCDLVTYTGDRDSPSRCAPCWRATPAEVIIRERLQHSETVAQRNRLYGDSVVSDSVVVRQQVEENAKRAKEVRDL